MQQPALLRIIKVSYAYPNCGDCAVSRGRVHCHKGRRSNSAHQVETARGHSRFYERGEPVRRLCAEFTEVMSRCAKRVRGGSLLGTFLTSHSGDALYESVARMLRKDPTAPSST